MVALQGTSFCTSAKDALKLIFANLGLIAVAGIVQDIVLFIGQWTITGGTVAVCWIYLNAIASDPTLLPANLRSLPLTYQPLVCIVLMWSTGRYLASQLHFQCSLSSSSLLLLIVSAPCLWKCLGKSSTRCCFVSVKTPNT